MVTRGNGTLNYEYDSRHNVTKVSNDNVVMNVTYNAKGNAVSKRYNSLNGRLSRVTRTAGSRVQNYVLSYNSWGQRTGVSVGNRVLAGYSYANNKGHLTQMTYGNGASVSYTYDNLERVTGISYNGSSTPTYVYSYKGKFISLSVSL